MLYKYSSRWLLRFQGWLLCFQNHHKGNIKHYFASMRRIKNDSDENMLPDGIIRVT